MQNSDRPQTAFGSPRISFTRRLLFPLAFVPVLLLPSLVLPQDSPTQGDSNGQARRSLNDRKLREKGLIEKLQWPYREWLAEDALYIITREERSAFLQLESDEEREQFIEQFWLRRNPNPDLLENARGSTIGASSTPTSISLPPPL